MADAKRNVLDTLEFNSPDEIPIQLWDLPWANIHYPTELNNIKRDFPNDIVNAPELLSKSTKTKGHEYKIGEYVDEWGCVFENKQDGIIGEVKNPVIKSWDNMEEFHIPDEFLSLELGEINNSNS